MLRALRTALSLFALLTLLTGVLYPALVTVVAQSCFPWQANGSLLHEGEQVVGSAHIAQAFRAEGWFHGRPSATTPEYNALLSSGSNLGPTHPALEARVQASLAALRASNLAQSAAIPIDLLTTSGSGLDPHISPAAALWQVPRVAAASGLDPKRLEALVRAQTRPRLLGLFGEERVNVLELNRELRSQR